MNRDKLFLADIVKACDKIASFIASGHDAFFADEMIQDAVIRNLEIVGEASKNLSSDVKSRVSDQPWRKITGMRDKLIHHYFGVKLEQVWKTASSVVPPFRLVIVALLNDMLEEESPKD